MGIFIHTYVQVIAGEHAGQKGTVTNIGVGATDTYCTIVLDDEAKISEPRGNLRNLTARSSLNFEARFAAFKRDMDWV